MDKSTIRKIAFISFIALLLLVVIVIIVRYQSVGETSLPFEVTKVLIVSTVDAEKVDDPDNTWNIPVDQVNDVYIYIGKSNEDKNERLIKEIKFENFNIKSAPNKGKVVIHRATGEINTGNLYTNSTEDYLKKDISFIGSEIDDMKNLEISNIGGVCGFRVATKELGTFISSEGEEVVYDGSLLSKLEIKNEDIKFKISYDMIITTDNNVSYKGTFEYELPTGNIVEEGKGSTEITDFSNIIFKRI